MVSRRQTTSPRNGLAPRDYDKSEGPFENEVSVVELRETNSNFSSDILADGIYARAYTRTTRSNLPGPSILKLFFRIQ